jgi:hypothetical protein
MAEGTSFGGTTRRRVHRLLFVLSVLAVAFLPGLAAFGSREADLNRNMELLANLPNAATNSDLAFWGDLAFAGDYQGFRVIDVSEPSAPVVLASVRCPGAQGDVSVWGTLLFRSIDRPQTSDRCEGRNVRGTAVGFEGIRIFDVGDPAAPRFVKAVATDCGSHTHTLVPDLGNGRVLLYVSSFPSPPLGPTPYGTDCQRLLEDGSQGHSKISIVEVPLADPGAARVVAEPYLQLSDFRKAGHRGCHDITVFLELRRAAAACLSEGQIWDISDRAAPRILERVDKKGVSIWHSAAFTWDGTRVLFGDESGGGGAPRCKVEDAHTVGAVWIYALANPASPLGSFKISRPQTGNCTAHNFNLVPVPGRDVLVSAWYTGGTSVADVSDPAAAVELGFYAAQSPAANTWSSYWYDGYVYANDIARGVDVLRFTGEEAVTGIRFGRLNPQTQESIVP